MECSLRVSATYPIELQMKTNVGYNALGPISESDFFTWEALISGPEGTPFVSCPLASYREQLSNLRST
jgi:hypothetical protein